MEPDNRHKALRAFRCSSMIVAAMFVVLAIAYGSVAIGSKLVGLGAATEAQPEVAQGYYALLIVLDAIQVFQLLICALFFVLIAHGNPFKKSSSLGLLALAVSFAVKAAAQTLVNAMIANLTFELGINIALRNQYLFDSLDVPSIAFAIFLVLLSFLFRYAQELFIDSEAII